MDKIRKEIETRNERARQRLEASKALRRKLFPGPTEEEKAHLVSVYGTCRPADCANCTYNRSMGSDGISAEFRRPCGQYRCWIALELSGNRASG